MFDGELRISKTHKSEKIKYTLYFSDILKTFFILYDINDIPSELG
jgi:hypothetical protein